MIQLLRLVLEQIINIANRKTHVKKICKLFFDFFPLLPHLREQINNILLTKIQVKAKKRKKIVPMHFFSCPLVSRVFNHEALIPIIYRHVITRCHPGLRAGTTMSTAILSRRNASAPPTLPTLPAILRLPSIKPHTAP